MERVKPKHFASDWRPVRKAELVAPSHDWGSEATVVGASILAFMVDDQHKLVFFLLGKQCKSLRWAEGSHALTDFGGGVAPSDRDPEETAAREFVEETLGVVQFFENDDATKLPRRRWDDIAESLRKGQYLRKVQSAYKESGTDVRKVYVTFVVPIPWEPHCTRRFRHCRTLLTATQSLLDHHPCPQTDLLTKTERDAMFPLNRFKKAQRHRWVLAHPSVVVRASEERSLAPSAEADLAPSWRCTATPPATSSRAPRVFDDAPRWGRAGSSKPKPVVEGVRSEFLEKVALQLWSVPKLMQALRHDGRMVTHDNQIETLKSCFMPMLHKVLKDLTRSLPHHFFNSPHVVMRFK